MSGMHCFFQQEPSHVFSLSNNKIIHLFTFFFLLWKDAWYIDNSFSLKSPFRKLSSRNPRPNPDLASWPELCLSSQTESSSDLRMFINTVFQQG